MFVCLIKVIVLNLDYKFWFFKKNIFFKKKS